MKKIITIINFKGGVAKTTSSINIASILAEKENKKVLLIDLDPQSNLTRRFIFPLEKTPQTIREVMTGEVELKEAIKNTQYKNIDLISSDIRHTKTELFVMQRINETNIYNILRNQINEIKDKYDYIIFDSPTDSNIITQNALIASTDVLIPSESSQDSAIGVKLILKDILQVQKTENPDLKIMGVFLTMKARTNSDKEITDFYETKLRKYFLKDYSIRKNEAVRRSAKKMKTLIETEINSNAYKDYLKLTEEVVMK